jgi:hyaluronoglucosaminidase
MRALADVENPMSCVRGAIAMVLAGALAMAACGDTATGADLDATIDLPGDPGDDEGALADVTDATDVFPPLSSLCPPAGAPVSVTGVVPQPWQFQDLGAAVEAGVWSVAGASADEVDEVQATAARAGGVLTDKGGWTVRFLDLSRWADLVAACGFATDLPAGSYYLRTGADGAFVAAPDDDGRFHALKTLKQLVVAGTSRVRAAAVLDRPAVAIRGFGESYYGIPWEPDARLAMIPILADLKCNFYMYAPKFDLAISTFWAYAFTPEMLAHLKAVTTLAKRNRMHTCLQIHPQGVRFSVPDDYDAALAKFHAAAAQGFECFVLAFDDSAKTLQPEDLGANKPFVEMQVEWSNRVGVELHSAYPDALLGFVPNDYWSGAEGVQTDLKYIGTHLDATWVIAWTGPEVGSRKIDAKDADDIAVVIGRPPFLADNHPVVDNTQSSGVMNLAPLEQRAGDLTAHVVGIIYNPMPLAFASLPGLATGLDFAWNSAAYTPQRSLTAVAGWMVGADATPAFETLSRANYSPYSSTSASPLLEAALSAFWTEHAARTPLDVAEGPAAVALRAMFTAYVAVPSGLAAATGDQPGFLADVKPWSDKLGAEGAAGLLALDLLGAMATGGVVDGAKLAELTAARAAMDETVAKPAGKLVTGFLTTAIVALTPPNP